MKKLSLIVFAGFALTACKQNQNSFDASGSFEADEVIVSARQGGQILRLQLHEGDLLHKDSILGNIDITGFQLQKEQVKASISSLQEKLNNAEPQIEVLKKQIAVQQSQVSYLSHEKKRLENLLKADAATQKQLDDMNARLDEAQRQLALIQQQIQMTSATVHIQNRGILSQKDPLEKSAEQADDQIQKGLIINPVTGIVLNQYAYAGEMTSPGKALYKIANTDTLMLRAYVTGMQLPQLRLGQPVKVMTDDGKGGYKKYEGRINWISSKAEFTPKTIQTKDERANMVYAIKIRVPNDGYLKIGMYGEVNF